MEEGRPVESLDISATKSSGRQRYYCKSESLTAQLSNLHHMFCVIISRNHNNAANNATNSTVNNATNNVLFSLTIKVAIR